MGHGDLGRARRGRPRDRRRARRPGHRARGPRRHRLEHPLRVGPGRPRRHGRRRRDHHDLPDDDGRRRRVHRVRLRGQGRLRRERRAAREAARHPGRAPRRCCGSSSSTGCRDGDAWILTLDEVRQLGREYLEGDPGAIDARIDGIQPDQLATIIYTSGTTGRPKGVRLRHSAWTYEGAAVDAHRTSSARTTCSTSGCRWPTSSARCCSPCRCRSASRRPSTAGSTRSSTTSPS